MTKEEKLAIMRNRAAKMENNGKNTKCPGVLAALTREIRNLERK